MIKLEMLDRREYPVLAFQYSHCPKCNHRHLPDKPKEFWTIDFFIDELVNLLNHFGIQDDFDLLGHSWGGILIMEFAVRRQPQGAKHLIVTNSLASRALWNQSTMKLLEPFPDWVKEGFMIGFDDPPKFQAAMKEFHAKHGCKVKPTPPEFEATMEWVFGPKADTTLWTKMCVIDFLHAPRVKLNIW